MGAGAEAGDLSGLEGSAFDVRFQCFLKMKGRVAWMA